MGHSFGFRDSYLIYRACELVFTEIVTPSVRIIGTFEDWTGFWRAQMGNKAPLHWSDAEREWQKGVAAFRAQNFNFGVTQHFITLTIV